MVGLFFVFILLGPPGSGKGTQAAMLHDKVHLPHISTGDLLRDHMRRGTELGKAAQSFVEKGNLVPDPLIMDMLFERVEKKDCAQGYILDGFPRTLPQAEALQNYLKAKATPIVVNLEISDDQVIARLAKRISCEKCGTPYHLIDHPPRKKGVCDKCGGPLVQRPDDSIEVITKRLQVYHQQTAPLIKYYDSLHLLHGIKCDRPKDLVFSEILRLRDCL